MRYFGLNSILLAAGLALAGPAIAQGTTAPTVNSQSPIVTAIPPAPAAAPAPVANSTPAPATTTPAANPNDPMLAENGAPRMDALSGIGQPKPGAIIGIQPQVTANGRFAAWMHDWILFPVITGISAFVLALLIWAILRYRQGANPIPSKTSHNTFIEVLWTLGPVIILVLIAIPSIGLLAAQYKPAPKNAITLKAIGNQWYWSYQYPDNGGFEITANMLKDKKDGDTLGPNERWRTDADGPRLLAVNNRIVLPVGVPIRLITTSNDVIHSWAVPAFWIKLDAVPGRLNETSFTIEKPGLYFGQCSELCGARHAYMPIAVVAVPYDVFVRWVAAKGGTMKPAGKTSTAMPSPDTTDNGSAADNVTGPTENTTATPSVSNQATTANPAGAGNPGQ